MINNPYGLSNDYWKKMTPKSQALYGLIRPMRRCNWSCNFFIKNIERDLESFATDAKSSGGTFTLEPDFQRGHVWSPEKQQAFIEAMLRGTAPMLVRFNCANYGDRSDPGDMNHADMVCVDGLQRITAIRKFVAGEVKPFGFSAKDFDNTEFDQGRMKYTYVVEMYAFTRRKHLLQFYVDLNSGGVVHTEEELARVRALMENT
jgi:hypothetical protein